MNRGAAATAVDGPERIVSLDVLRGFALLGILAMNIGSFSMTSATYFDPTAYGDLTGINGWVWRLTHTFADLKFMAIFSMLFGAGIVLMAERMEAREQSPIGIHHRRMAWLVAFGLLHAHLLWYGDILYWYGLAGMVVFWFRRLSPRWLIIWGTASLAVASLLLLAGGLTADLWPPDVYETIVGELKPSAETATAEIEAYRGSWLAQMAERVPSAIEMETSAFFAWAVWRVSGLMLLGMALFKLGVLSARRSRAVYLRLIAVALLVGVPVIAFGIRWNFARDWQAPEYFFLGSQFNYWASLTVALGWIGAVMLFVQSAVLPRLQHALAAVGKLAFTNYILQTVICTWIFYGHGLGLFGQVDRVGQMAIMVGVWVVQLAASPAWLRRFRMGPLEWLWRSLVYLRPQPFKRRASTA